MWTLTVEGGALQRTDARTGRSTAVSAPIDLGGGEFPALAAGGGALWQAHSAKASGGVTKVDPRDGTAMARAGLAGAAAVVAADDGVWATARRGAAGELVRIDPESARVTRGPVVAGREPVAVIRAGDAVWVADRRRDALPGYDPRPLRLRARIPVGDGPAALATPAGELWVANLDDRTLTHVDAGSGQVVGAPVGLGKEIQAIAGIAGASSVTLLSISAHAWARSAGSVSSFASFICWLSWRLSSSDQLELFACRMLSPLKVGSRNVCGSAKSFSQPTFGQTATFELGRLQNLVYMASRLTWRG